MEESNYKDKIKFLKFPEEQTQVEIENNGKIEIVRIDAEDDFHHIPNMSIERMEKILEKAKQWKAKNK